MLIYRWNVARVPDHLNRHTNHSNGPNLVWKRVLCSWPFAIRIWWKADTTSTLVSHLAPVRFRNKRQWVAILLGNRSTTAVLHRTSAQKARWYNDLHGHSLHMRERPLALALPRRRACIGHVTSVRQAREERDLRASRISSVSHMSCILTSRLSIYDSWSSIFHKSLVLN